MAIYFHGALKWIASHSLAMAVFPIFYPDTDYDTFLIFKFMAGITLQIEQSGEIAMGDAGIG